MDCLSASTRDGHDTLEMQTVTFLSYRNGEVLNRDCKIRLRRGRSTEFQAILRFLPILGRTESRLSWERGAR